MSVRMADGGQPAVASVWRRGGGWAGLACGWRHPVGGWRMGGGMPAAAAGGWRAAALAASWAAASCVTFLDNVKSNWLGEIDPILKDQRVRSVIARASIDIFQDGARPQ